MFLVGYGDGMRVVIHTSNLRQSDFADNAQTAYVQDFPVKTKFGCASGGGDGGGNGGGDDGGDGDGDDDGDVDSEDDGDGGGGGGGDGNRSCGEVCVCCVDRCDDDDRCR